MIKLKQEILGALARGYTTDKNAKKEMDVELVEAMGDEVMKLFEKELPKTVTLAYDNFAKNKSTIEDLVNNLINTKNKR